MRTFLEDQYFKRHLSEYAQVVDDIKSGVIPCGEEFSLVNVKKLPPHIKGVFAARYNGGKTVLVEFGEGFYSILFYEGEEYDTEIKKDITPEKRWQFMRHIMGKWYYVPH